MSINDRNLTINQRVGLTRLWNNHPEGVVLRLSTARALVDRGFCVQPSVRRPAWVKLGAEGVLWCEAMGW